MERLNANLQKFGEEIYKNMGAEGAGGFPGGAPGTTPGADAGASASADSSSSSSSKKSGNDDDVIDADFEVVDEDK